MWRNWAGDETCEPAAIERPGSVGEVVEAVGRAAAAGQTVRVAGAGHSFSDLVPTDGRLLSLQRMRQVLDADRASGLVRVQAGITVRELNERLAALGLAMENLGDIDVQTIAGAISTATHGTGAGLRNLSAQVSELELVTADGTLVRCAADADAGDPDLLPAARVGLGALGVIVSVTLRCVPAFTLHGVERPRPLDEVLDSLPELAAASEHFELFTFPHTGVALTRTNRRTPDPPRPRGRGGAWAQDVLLTNHAFELFCRTGRRIPALIPRLNRTVTRLASTTERTDRSDRIFASPRLVRFTEMEYAVPAERTAEAVRRVLSLVDERGFSVPFPIEVRVVAGDDALISPAYERASGYVAVHMYRGMEWEPYFRAVADAMDELGGRPHWGKRHFHAAATLRERYPRWDDFQAVRARLDPEGRFANAHVQRVLGAAAGGQTRST